MVQTLKKQTLYYILYLCSLLSLIAIQDTGSGMFVLLAVLPMGATILGVVYGLKQEFSVYYNLIIGVLSLVILFVSLRQIDAVLVYTGIYTALSFVGNLVGFWLRKLGKQS